MGSAVASVESVCNLLSRSRLLKPPQVQGLYKHWRRLEARGGAAEVDRFLKWLVTGHHITAYQARQLAVGQVQQFFLNHYRLLDLIGKGRMAGIYKASHMLGHIVAVKLMPASKSQDAQLLARFRREGKMAVRLKHPNIVRTHHLGDAAGKHYIVMEHLEGETLEDVLKRRKKLPPPEAVRLIHQALRGLQHIHEQSIVHRDLSPGNLMLVPPRPPGAPDSTLWATIKILDIGMGRVLFDEGVSAESSINLQLTTAGMILGTPEYMAPEQARNAHAADIRSDIYGLGCILYHVLAGQPPFTAKVGFDVLLKHFSEKPRPIRELEPAVPEGLQAALNAMLAKDPGQRPATPDQAARALEPFLPASEHAAEPVSSLVRSYESWVASQPLEEVNGTPTTAERWYYSRNGLSIGPVPTAQLANLVKAERIGPTDLLWMDGDNPDLAIPAKAALDFSGITGKPLEQRHTQHAATAAARPPAGTPVAYAVPTAPGSPPGPPMAVPISAPVANAPTATLLLDGFDPDTGQVYDQARFTQWQREQRVSRVQQSTAPTHGEIFHKARIHLDRWLDFDRNRGPILTGDLECIRQDPDIVRFMNYHARYGPDMVHKLWAHLQFMVENRRKYYCALG